MPPCVFDGSLLGLSHPMLDLGEGLLDGVEVGRVGRQEPEPGAGCLDEVADSGGFVGAEIVHDDNVTGLEHGHQLLLDIGPEALSVDRPVEDTRRHQPVAAQRAEEGQRAPVAVWGEAAQALASRSPAAQRCHVGLDPRLVDEHQPPWIETGLERAPALSAPGNVGTCLLKGEQRFF